MGILLWQTAITSIKHRRVVGVSTDATDMSEHGMSVASVLTSAVC